MKFVCIYFDVSSTHWMSPSGFLFCYGTQVEDLKFIKGKIFGEPKSEPKGQKVEKGRRSESVSSVIPVPADQCPMQGGSRLDRHLHNKEGTKRQEAQNRATMADQTTHILVLHETKMIILNWNPMFQT